MSFSLDGYVLRPSRTSPSNAPTTSAVDNGVVHDVKTLPALKSDFDTEMVDLAADQYRTAVLHNPDAGEIEYLLWAANTSNLSVLEDASWAVATGTGSIPTGTGSVLDTASSIVQTDGTTNIVIVDNAGRSIAGFLSVTVVRGDGGGTFIFSGGDFDAATRPSDGLLVLDSSVVGTADPDTGDLSGGLSKRRGDVITAVSYYLEGQKFWWTRNDPYLSRFGWNGKVQRWEPYRGSAPVNLGVVTATDTYVLTPRPFQYQSGDVLPGSVVADSYSMVRIGAQPNASSVPVAVLVVPDEEVEKDTPNFSGYDAIVGALSGVLKFDPTYATTNLGSTIWYVYNTFQADATGNLGLLSTAGLTDHPLFLTPIPDATDRPMVRLGFRKHLNVVGFDTEALQAAAAAPSEGTVYWARSTGRLRLSSADINKAVLGNVAFDKNYLGCAVYYDGVTLSQEPVQATTPVPLVDAGGVAALVTTSEADKLYVPLSVPFPTPGTSGVLYVPDGTGDLPDSTITPETRPNGSGLVRDILSVGDTLLFTKDAVVEDIAVVEYVSDLPAKGHKIPQGTAYIAREAGVTTLSEVRLSRADRKRFAGQQMYFAQANVTFATYAPDARIFSRVKEPYTIESAVTTLRFAVNGTTYTWTASGSGNYTASQVAADMQTNAVPALPANTVKAVNGHVVLTTGNLTSGTLEIAHGPNTTDRDLTGCKAFGFLPGWRLDFNSNPKQRWLADSGVSMGVFRSPVNLDRTQEDPDFKAQGRFEDTTLTESVTASPYQLLPVVPLQDVAGYDNNVFFQTKEGLHTTNLVPLEGVQYDFEQGKIAWLDQGSVTASVEQTTSTLSLGNSNVVPETLDANVSGALFVAEDGGSFGSALTLDTDFTVPNSGVPGLVQLIRNVGALQVAGVRGNFSVSTGTFTDDTSSFGAVQVGWKLKVLTGNVSGWYTITGVVDADTLTVTPEFQADGVNVSWEVYEGFETSVFDATLIADQSYRVLNHLNSEPFVIRQLTSLGALSSASNAYVRDALASGRPLSIRLGLEYGGADYAVNMLSSVELGTLRNGTDQYSALRIPDVGDVHFTTESFQIRIGTQVVPDVGYTLSGVATFSDPDTLTNTVEYLTGNDGGFVTGNLQFSTDLLSAFTTAKVAYHEVFLDPSDVPVATVELDPSDGAVNFTQTDLTVFPDTEVYFIEQMVTENRLDVVTSPVVGGILFNKPLRTGQIVEVSYCQADTTGAKISSPIVEQLPLFVRQEIASPTADARVWTINPSNRTIYTAITPQVYVGNQLQNYGNTEQVQFDLDNNRIVFLNEVSGTVYVTYAVLEAFGGEQAYTVSSPPVYRPPFFLEAGQDSFALAGDRTFEIQANQLLRVGSDPFWVSTVTYDAGTDSTFVGITPTPVREAGSRSPGNDAGLLLSSGTIKTLTGYMLSLDPGVVYDPVGKGHTTITFKADMSRFAVPGHILEVGDDPYLIQNVTLDASNQTTSIEVTSPFVRSYSGESIRISARPIYPPNATDFLGLAPIMGNQPFEVVLYKSGEPGQSLAQGVDYTIDLASGAVRLLRDVFEDSDRLHVWYTEQRTIGPFYATDDSVSGGTFTPGDMLGDVVYPRYKATYSYVTIPSVDNGLLGNQLKATYSYRNPDTFYTRVVPLDVYIGEVADQAAKAVEAQNPHGGPIVAIAPSTQNHKQGSEGYTYVRRDLVDQDRAARVFVSFYNAVISRFEQILETTQGIRIGDRDGRFRFEVGKGLEYPTPGYEDDITGSLLPRNVWVDLFKALSGQRVSETDNLVDPVTGKVMDPDRLATLVASQKGLITNNVDDVVLTSSLRPTFSWRAGTLPSVAVQGKFLPLWQPSVLSRLFPEKAVAFTQTEPGIGSDIEADNPGVYSFKTSIVEDGVSVTKSTWGTPIASISNPVLGTVQNVTDVAVRDRMARARIWGYSETGYPTLDAATTGKPTVIATPLLLKDFPVDPTTGLPDISQLVAQGGPLLDLSTGEPELSVPPFVDFDLANKILPQVQFGQPDGTLRNPVTGSVLSADVYGNITIGDYYSGLFVHTVRKGCLITFTDDTGGAEIVDPGEIKEVVSGTTTRTVTPKIGDTIFIVPPSNQRPDALSPAVTANPPKLEDAAALADLFPGYKNGSDVGVDMKQGRLLDRTLPGFADAFPAGLKELSGQKAPKPMTPVEMDVSFHNSSLAPIEIPALTGSDKNDSGDYTLPFVGMVNTEITLLKDLQGTASTIQVTDSPLPGAVYPDEIIGVDGVIYATASGALAPATLHTASDLTPLAGPYVAGSGIGDMQSFDFMLFERGQDLPGGGRVGSEGILSTGKVTSTTWKPPRFVSKSLKGDEIKYLFENYGAHVGGGVTGVSITVGGGNTVLTFTNPGMVFNDGVGAFAVGGVNDIISNGLSAWNATPGLGNSNKFRIRLYHPTTGVLKQDLEIGDGTFRRVDGVVRADSAVVAAGGAGYTNGDFLTLSGGTFTTPAIFKVTGVGGGGDVLTVAHAVGTAKGFYTAAPSNPVSVTGGTGLGCTLTVTFAQPSDTGVALPSFQAIIIQVPGVTEVAEATGGSLYDFAVSVDTYDGMVGGGAATGSDTEFVDADRLTFKGVLDTRQAKPDGFTSALSVANLQAELSVFEITASGSVGVTVNKPDEVNGGDAFTFLAPNSGSPNTLDVSWAIASGSGLGDEVGTIEVPAFRGHTNIDLPNTDIRFSGMPSSAQDVSGVICEGAAVHVDASNALISVVPATGDVANVQSGDVLVIDESAIGDGCTKMGTYIVRHAIKKTGGPANKHVVELSSKLVGGVRVNSGIHVAFPEVLAFDEAVPSLRLRLNGPEPLERVFNTVAAGRLYILKSDLADSVSVAYTTQTGDTFTGLGTPLDATGAALAGGMPAFFASIQVGDTVSGFTRLICRDAPAPLPGNNIQGYDHGVTTIAGFTDIALINPTFSNVDKVYTFGVDLETTGTFGAGDLGVSVPTPADPWTYAADERTVVYTGVADYIDISKVSNAQWLTIHGTAPAGLRCFLPGDSIVANSSLDADGASIGTVGFTAMAGIFVEPSTPKPVLDLRKLKASVVYNGYDTGSQDVGFRYSADYFPVPTTQESVHFEVRRARRWHEVSAPDALLYVYKTRTGSIYTYDATTRIVVADPYEGRSTWGTNLGPFTDPNVNIHAGDLLRVYDGPLVNGRPSGNLVQEVTIASVYDGLRFELVSPGLQVPVVDSFEVYLRTAPVPLEQSYNELLSLVTEKVVFTQVAAYDQSEGGKVDTVNELLDYSGSVNYLTLGVQEGDILLVDPAGELRDTSDVVLSPPEFGTRPFGDTSVSGRASFSAGSPSQLDDNRGHYRVVSVSATTLEVDGAHEEWADGSMFGDAGQEFVVLPTVQGEGQNDLRVTAPISVDTFRVGGSIEPFSYKIIRPSGLFSEQAIDLVLVQRERFLSWLEEVERWTKKMGSYYTFQRDKHILDVGIPTDADAGLGVLSNAFLVNIVGLVDTAPFENVNDCLSILDRRVWDKDLTLDLFVPIATTPKTMTSIESVAGGSGQTLGSGQPTLPERITEVLDNIDRFRALRMTWLRYRTHRITGTLASIQRYDLQAPDRTLQQRDLRRIQQSASQV